MVIKMYDAENFEFKFSRVRRHLESDSTACFNVWYGVEQILYKNVIDTKASMKQLFEGKLLVPVPV